MYKIDGSPITGGSVILADATCLPSSLSEVPITAASIAGFVPRASVLPNALILSRRSSSDSISLPLVNAIVLTQVAFANGAAVNCVIVLMPALEFFPPTSATTATSVTVSSPAGSVVSLRTKYNTSGFWLLAGILTTVPADTNLSLVFCASTTTSDIKWSRCSAESKLSV